ncbi:DsbC family protein [Bordetella genomosp. 13]|uniref:DsbC family protein n=1 Tax=Bordetella genomosp. 13 TaxID=463040 RepID=UPI00119EDDB1|nr:DsbC family protein [Bordetella genomosp. 13]
MKFRIAFSVAASLCALFMAGAVQAQPAGQSGKSYSTSGADKPAAGARSTRTPAPDPVADGVRKRFIERFPDTEVTAVQRTPYGLFEVQLGMELVYTDEDVRWVMQGTLIDAMSRRNVTAERQERLGEVPLAELPLELAVKQVRGNGKRRVAIFEDPNCGYCKQLHKTIETLDDVTIYTFLYPILAPDSTVKSRDIWCASEPARAWNDWMIRGKTPASKSCDAPTQQVLELGKRLMVRGTPTMFFDDGSRVSGAMPLDQFQARLDGRR